MSAQSNLIVLPSVDSTNTYAKAHFAELPDGVVVSAIEQTAGRGRLGRKWQTPPGVALTATAVFKHVSAPFHAGCIAGLAGLELIREHAPETFSFFKWPNDIYVRERKISGILSEGIVSGGKISGVVSGIGININQDAAAIESLGVPATSLRLLAGSDFCLESLRIQLAEKLNRYYIMYQSNSESLLSLWRYENRLIGEQLEVTLPDGGKRTGLFRSITRDGGMMLESEGKVFYFDCGDVKINASLINFESLEAKHKLRKGQS